MTLEQEIAEAAEAFFQKWHENGYKSLQSFDASPSGAFTAGARWGYSRGAMDALKYQPDLAHELAEARTEIELLKLENAELHRQIEVLSVPPKTSVYTPNSGVFTTECEE